ncbi:hypothetical protein [Edwardsiella hoshinae]|nr:hypothetical protein [Edwardsiella hoshinae]
MNVVVMKSAIRAALLLTPVFSQPVQAEAWQAGSNGGALGLGGDLYSTTYTQKWAWAVGSGLNHLSSPLNAIDPASRTARLAVSQNTPLLLGKTLEAFAAPKRGGVGSIPLISFSDGDGKKVELRCAEGGDGYPRAHDNGLAYIVLPVKDPANNTPIGTARLNLTYVGASAQGGASGSNGKVFSRYAMNQAMAFFGALPINVSGAEIQNGANAVSQISALGGPNLSALLGQIQAVNSNITALTPATGSWVEYTNYSDGTVFSAAYALGFKAGQTVDVIFNRRPAQTTAWTASLRISVTYN